MKHSNFTLSFTFMIRNWEWKWLQSYNYSIEYKCNYTTSFILAILKNNCNLKKKNNHEKEKDKFMIFHVEKWNLYLIKTALLNFIRWYNKIN